MKAGLELDVKIAAVIMGYHTHFMDGGVVAVRPPMGGPSLGMPQYSDDIEAAFQVVWHIKATFGLMKVSGLTQWQAKFGDSPWIDGDTAAHAICEAALDWDRRARK